MQILVTGGAGYIGSHTCVALLEAGHKVIVADNLCNSKVETIDQVEQITNKKITFYQIDVTDEKAVDTIFSNHSIDGIIHFAGLKAVGESVEKPLAYYYNNTISTMVLSSDAMSIIASFSSCDNDSSLAISSILLKLGGFLLPFSISLQ
jgi:UDP-glucose 4-epimerase